MNTALLITNARIITSTRTIESGWLLTNGKHVARMGSGNPPGCEGAERIDAAGLTLLPGFIDIHVHGAVGYDAMDAEPAGLQAMARYYAQHGVTSFLPTTTTAPYDEVMSALKTIAMLQGGDAQGAAILGAHLEGPYINASRRGAQRLQDIRRAEQDEALTFLDLNVIRLISLAPEFDENLWLIREATQRGITVSLAHTAATYEQVLKAAALGLSHSTHTYNAMRGFGHREPGTVGAVMTLPQIFCELIADKIHVHPASMNVLFLTKGVDRIVLITDSVRAAGMPDGEYELDERTVVVKDGAVRLADGTLAGSTLTMDRALANFLRATDQPLEAGWKTSSLNAARSLHLSAQKGSLEVGKDADLVLVDEAIKVYLTVVEGVVVHRLV